MQFLDARNLKCPLPVLKARQLLAKMSSGETLKIWCQDPAAPADFKSFCDIAGHELVSIMNQQEHNEIIVRKKS